MTLAVNVNRLTREHLAYDHNKQPVRVPALLDQLNEAVKPSQAGGASGSTSPRLPIDTKAFALRQDIERELREHQHERVGNSVGTLVGILHAWATLDGEWADYLERVTLGWCDQIVALLVPARPYHPSQPCPSCSRRFHGEENAPTLSVYWRNEAGDQLHPHDWHMTCGACDAEWAGETLGHIAKAMSGHAA